MFQSTCASERWVTGLRREWFYLIALFVKCCLTQSMKKTFTNSFYVISFFRITLNCSLFYVIICNYFSELCMLDVTLKHFFRSTVFKPIEKLEDKLYTFHLYSPPVKILPHLHVHTHALLLCPIICKWLQIS